MKEITLILISIFLMFSCSKDKEIEGTYKHKLCKYGPSCNYFDFNNDGTFCYNKISDRKQHKKFNGRWTLNNDTIYLVHNGFIQPDSTVVELTNNLKSNTTIISVNMLGSYEVGSKPDTLGVLWYVSLNGSKNYSQTDSLGNLEISKKHIDKIQIRDVFQNMGKKQLFRHKDSIFIIDAEVDEVKIYLSLRERESDDVKYMPKKFLKDDELLYPIDYTDDIEYLKRENNYYRLSEK